MASGVHSYTPVFVGDAFARAAAYRALSVASGKIHEPPIGRASFPYSERHVQCVWYDPAFRPSGLRTQDGERVTVEDPGTWNLEAGPDFLGAVLRAGPHRRRLKGDVEVHVHPSGWRQHGHLEDPRYSEVRFHVTWFPGSLPTDALPPGALQIPLRDPALRDPTFSMEAIDVAAYPYATRARVPPCSRVLEGWDADARQALLDAAGEERLRRKADRLAARIDDVGGAQALYEEVLTALGYKHNRWPFRTLAVRVPLDELRSIAAEDACDAYAVLLGVAGLLPDQLAPRWDAATRRFVRRLWDAWWRHRARWETRIMKPDAWRLSGCRPPNRPERRMMAAARLFAAPEPLEDRIAAAAGSPVAMRAPFLEPADTYWDRRLSLGGAVQDQATALIGRARANAILVNVLVPFLAATGPGGNVPRELLDALPAAEDHQVLRQTAHWLFGPDHPPSLYRNGLRRQGLTQIFHDFCLQDRSRCASCRLPNALRAFRGDRTP